VAGVSVSTVDRIPCVGAIVVDEAGRLLLVRRGQEPAKGSWSVPGGRVEVGESDENAIVREVLEETGLPVVCGRLVGTVERDAPAGGVYVIRDYQCQLAAGAHIDAVHAGDDAADAGWFSAEEVSVLGCAPGLVDVLRKWDVLPA
jgi:8-oxo-dGTP diphosphatase